MNYARDWYSHIVLIGHGTTDGVQFMDNGTEEVSGETFEQRLTRLGVVSAQRVVELLGCNLGCRNVEIISLCCHSGCETIGSELSRAKNVDAVIAPSGVVSTQWAAHFVTDYFLRRFVNNEKNNQAVFGAVKACVGSSTLCAHVPMRLWHKGHMVCDPCADQ